MKKWCPLEQNSIAGKLYGLILNIFVPMVLLAAVILLLFIMLVNFFFDNNVNGSFFKLSRLFDFIISTNQRVAIKRKQIIFQFVALIF